MFTLVLSLTFCPLRKRLLTSTITYVLSIEKEIARDLQDDDIINEFAAKDKNGHIVLF